MRTRIFGFILMNVILVGMFLRHCDKSHKEKLNNETNCNFDVNRWAIIGVKGKRPLPVTKIRAK